MHSKPLTRRVLRVTLILVATMAIIATTGIYLYKQQRTPEEPSAAQFIATYAEPLPPELGFLANGPDRSVLAARYGRNLVRLNEGGNTTEPLHSFDHSILGIHTTPQNWIMVSTVDEPTNPDSLCEVYLSKDQGHSFQLTKTIDRPGGCPRWWSMASNAAGVLYIGEYGPKHHDMSKNLWRSTDQGHSWQRILTVGVNDQAHVHRIAVDPYTQDVWLTVGDGHANRGIFRSTDSGDHWSKVFDSQATGIAFTPEGIYWGEDLREGEIWYTDRKDLSFRMVFRASKVGAYGGSSYDLAIGCSNHVYAIFTQYPNQKHHASLWVGQHQDWRLLIQAAYQPDKATSLSTIAGPDRRGWLYTNGYRIRDECAG